MDKLEAGIGYTFKNKALLTTALTHSSYANERHGGAESYERLEFLGDSILGVVTADFLYRHEPKLPEGRMTRLRAELVCEASLHRVALELGLGQYMRLGRGEEHTGGRERASILADMVESIIAAMYIDTGSMDESRRFIMEKILSRAELGDQHCSDDYKTRLHAEPAACLPPDRRERSRPLQDVPLRRVHQRRRGGRGQRQDEERGGTDGGASGAGGDERMSARESIIPVFVPHLGCPNDCVL